MYRVRGARLLICQIGFLGLLAIDILCMPLTELVWYGRASKWVVYVIATMFWVSWIAIIAATLLLSRVRESALRKKPDLTRYRGVGVVKFFQNKYAVVADIVMSVALIAFVAVILWAEHLLVLSFILLAILIFSFGMHCILNGVNYKFVTEIRRRKKHE